MILNLLKFLFLILCLFHLLFWFSGGEYVPLSKKLSSANHDEEKSQGSKQHETPTNSKPKEPIKTKPKPKKVKRRRGKNRCNNKYVETFRKSKDVWKLLESFPKGKDLKRKAKKLLVKVHPDKLTEEIDKCVEIQNDLVIQLGDVISGNLKQSDSNEEDMGKFTFENAWFQDHGSQFDRRRMPKRPKNASRNQFSQRNFDNTWFQQHFDHQYTRQDPFQRSNNIWGKHGSQQRHFYQTKSQHSSNRGSYARMSSNDFGRRKPQRRQSYQQKYYFK